MNNNNVVDAEHFDRLLSLYQWSFTTFITIFAIVIAFIGVIQWRLSSKQIEKMKQDTKYELLEEYKLGEISILKSGLSKTENRLNLIIENYKGNFNPMTASSVEQYFDYIIGQILERARLFREDNIPDNVSKAIINDVNKVFLESCPGELTDDNKNGLKLVEIILDMKASGLVKATTEYNFFKENVKDFPEYVPD